LTHTGLHYFEYINMSDLEQTTSGSKYGGGASDGVGFGNKSNAASAEPEIDNSSTRFDKHEDTAPYSGHGATKHASGTVGGAGFGNKATESFNKNGTSSYILTEAVLS
jgi:hypothetical protein